MSQPIRKKHVQDREPRRFDKTSLQHDHYQDIVHRDYAAHFFRWSWIARALRGKKARVLDVGCGPRAMLARVLASHVSLVPDRYVGVDLNNIDCPNLRWAHFLPKFDFVAGRPLRVLDKDGKLTKTPTFDTAVCLEVIEHMGAADGTRLLKRIWEVLAPGGTLYLSTPVFDGYRARNHIHEYVVPELQRKLERGFHVIKRWGTFCSINHIYKLLSPAELEVWDALAAYYDNDVLSTMFAPLRPDQARNNLWVCERKMKWR